MDRQTAKVINEEARAAMEEIFRNHGLKMTAARASFDTGEFSVKFTGQEQGAASPRVADWHRYAAGYGLPDDALGKTIIVTVRGIKTAYKIEGLVVTRSKFPVAVTNVVSGKEMLLTVAGVRNGLGLTGPATV